MPRNIEIKAKVADIGALRQLTRGLATKAVQVLHQEDVFFACQNGRLKLRIFEDGQGELIQYERPDQCASSQSTYQIVPISDPSALRAALAASLGETVVVKKRREVWIVRKTRVHLDVVEGLGDFMELEVILEDAQTIEEGKERADSLMKVLRIRPQDLISVAYADLIIQQKVRDCDGVEPRR